MVKCFCLTLQNLLLVSLGALHSTYCSEFEVFGLSYFCWGWGRIIFSAEQLQLGLQAEGPGTKSALCSHGVFLKEALTVCLKNQKDAGLDTLVQLPQLSIPEGTTSVYRSCGLWWSQNYLL